MKRVAIIISYDGTNYAGFQIQKNALSIEEVLNSIINEIIDRKDLFESKQIEFIKKIKILKEKYNV